MLAEAKWHDERKTAIEIVVLSELTDWEPFDAAIDQAIELAKMVCHEIIIILNPRGVSMPKTDMPLPHLRRLMRGLPPNVKFVAGVLEGLGFFERSIADVVANITFRNRLKLVRTAEDAYCMIP